MDGVRVESLWFILQAGCAGFCTSALFPVLAATSGCLKGSGYESSWCFSFREYIDMALDL